MEVTGIGSHFSLANAANADVPASSADVFRILSYESTVTLLVALVAAAPIIE